MYVFDDIFSSSFFLLKCKMTSGNDYSIIDNKIKFMKNSFVSTRVCCCYCCRHTSFEFEWNLFRLPWEITHAKKSKSPRYREKNSTIIIIIVQQ